MQRYAKRGKTGARYGPRPPRPATLAPYAAYVRGRLADYPERSAVRLVGELRPLGYGGGYTMVKDFVRQHRPRLPLAFETRFEVVPGDQAQVGCPLGVATFTTPFGTVYALLVVVSWSRVLWVRFGFAQDELTVLGGLHQAFVAFGGVPRPVLFDRMKTAVVGAEADGTAVFNAELLRFAAHCGFTPRACRPYRAKTKGRVERSVAYLRDRRSTMDAAFGIWRTSTPSAPPGCTRPPTRASTPRPTRYRRPAYGRNRRTCGHCCAHRTCRWSRSAGGLRGTGSSRTTATSTPCRTA